MQGLNLKTMVSVENEKPKSIPFLRLFYIPWSISILLIEVEAVRKLRLNLLRRFIGHNNLGCPNYLCSRFNKVRAACVSC